ncbi:hypothetical protein V8F33_013572 [Rhypophila sp. PSN 637]
MRKLFRCPLVCCKSLPVFIFLVFSSFLAPRFFLLSRFAIGSARSRSSRWSYGRSDDQVGGLWRGGTRRWTMEIRECGRVIRIILVRLVAP